MVNTTARRESVSTVPTVNLTCVRNRETQFTLRITCVSVTASSTLLTGIKRFGVNIFFLVIGCVCLCVYLFRALEPMELRFPRNMIFNDRKFQIRMTFLLKTPKTNVFLAESNLLHIRFRWR